MSELSESQLLLLDNLIYLNGVAVDGENERTVKDVIEILLRPGALDTAMTDNGSDAACMSYKEWVQILENIQNDPELMNLKITNAVDNYSSDPKGGMRAACFVDSENNATAVFRGTGGAMEWHDNGVGAYSAVTPQQEEALKWIEGLSYDSITVTGHSKGGNKAQALSC